jgi:hypothetical protein
MIRIDTSKSIAVTVIEGDFPVMMFSSIIFPEWCALPTRFHSEEFITLDILSANGLFPCRSAGQNKSATSRGVKTWRGSIVGVFWGIFRSLMGRVNEKSLAGQDVLIQR